MEVGANTGGTYRQFLREDGVALHVKVGGRNHSNAEARGVENHLSVAILLHVETHRPRRAAHIGEEEGLVHNQKKDEDGWAFHGGPRAASSLGDHSQPSLEKNTIVLENEAETLPFLFCYKGLNEIN